MGEEDITQDPLLANLPKEGNRVRLGGCLLVRKLGQGGMGAVYLGKHLSLKVPVAVKVLSFEEIGADLGIIARFRREARVAARIDHGNLVRVYDVGEEHGVYYLVMEYVDGESAQERLEREGPLPEADALGIVVSIGDALSAAHAKNVIHRDVKPSNILIRHEDGRVKLADLGLAKDTEKTSTAIIGATVAGQMMGTPAFIPPEQIDDAAHVDARADVYSLGATLYALLSGRPPFAGSDFFSIVAKALKERPEDLRKLRPEVSYLTAQVVARSLEKKREDRFQSVEEMTASLRATRQSLNFAQTILARPSRADKTMRMDLGVLEASSVTGQPSPAADADPDATLPDLSDVVAVGLPAVERASPGIQSGDEARVEQYSFPAEAYTSGEARSRPQKSRARKIAAIVFGIIVVFAGVFGAVVYFAEPETARGWLRHVWKVEDTAGTEKQLGESVGQPAEPGSEGEPAAEPELSKEDNILARREAHFRQTVAEAQEKLTSDPEAALRLLKLAEREGHAFTTKRFPGLEFPDLLSSLEPSMSDMQARVQRYVAILTGRRKLFERTITEAGQKLKDQPEEALELLAKAQAYGREQTYAKESGLLLPDLLSSLKPGIEDLRSEAEAYKQGYGRHVEMRKKAFDQLVTEAQKIVQTDPSKALLLLKKVEEIGRPTVHPRNPNVRFPDLLWSLDPSIEQMRTQAERAMP